MENGHYKIGTRSSYIMAMEAIGMPPTEACIKNN